MRRLIEIGRSGFQVISRNRLRSAVTTAALVAVLLPYVTGIAISKGIQTQAEQSIRSGADLYVSGRRFGRDVPIPLTAVAAVSRIDGVTHVTPRIVGRVRLGRHSVEAVLVGLPVERFPAAVACVEGRLPERNTLHELVVGSELARRLGLKVGALIPPFYSNPQGERVSKVVGIFKSDISMWQANLVLTSLEDAAAIFAQPDLATDLLVDCRPGYEARVRAAIARAQIAPQDRSLGVSVLSRQELEAWLPGSLLHREGIFNLHFLLCFIVGILVMLVTSGLGLTERRREIGILKAVGWQTDEVLIRSLSECVALSLAGSSIAILLAVVWLKGLNGFWIASLFLSGVSVVPAITVPFELAPFTASLVYLLGLILVLAGTLYSTWRAAIVSPIEALR